MGKHQRVSLYKGPSFSAWPCIWSPVRLRGSSQTAVLGPSCVGVRNGFWLCKAGFRKYTHVWTPIHTHACARAQTHTHTHTPLTAHSSLLLRLGWDLLNYSYKGRCAWSPELSEILSLRGSWVWCNCWGKKWENCLCDNDLFLQQLREELQTLLSLYLSSSPFK